MNLENFHEFLEEPSHLYRVSYQELKSLVVQYPYSLPLRVLLLIKSKMEKHPDFETNLRIASTYARDREHLYRLLNDPDSALYELDGLDGLDDILELKDISEIRLTIEDLPAGEPTTKPENHSVATPPEEVILPEVHPENGSQAHPSPTNSGQVQSFPDGDPGLSTGPDFPFEPLSGFAILLDIDLWPETGSLRENTEASPESMDPGVPIPTINFEAKSSIPEGNEALPDQSTPLPKVHFGSWKEMGQLKGEFIIPAPMGMRAGAKKSSKSGKKKVSEAKRLARESLTENQEVISETLAALLVKQGQYDRALQMYEQLRLKFPEKSAFFAEQIENLKKS